MRVVLAPMEGVADASMRHLLTQIGGYDWCVSEFIRVVDHLLPDRVFHKFCPELANNSQTLSGTPMRVQLLGQHPQYLAENAQRAIELGSYGLDLNFGCPAKTVNKSQGGAYLLQYPENIYKIVEAVRQALPMEHVLSAKIRLGWEDKGRCVEIAQAIESAGANELTVHARTKAEGYKAPAHWHYIKLIKQATTIPLIANGEIWGREDYLRCQALSGCDDVMLGRGALAVPNLALVVKGSTVFTWQQVLQQLLNYSQYEIVGTKNKYYPSRIKQWLKFLAHHYPQADELFLAVRALKCNQKIIEIISGSSS